MRIFIFGDIGGHFDPFMKALVKLGVNPDNGEVPPDTGIIQVGDLVHRGPKSDELVAWVDMALKVNQGPDRGRWVQLFGNHEGHHLGGPLFGEHRDGEFHEYVLATSTEKILKRWWSSKRGVMAAAIRRTDQNQPKDVLVTHAGLAWQTWVGIGKPETVQRAAMSLNAQTAANAFAPGWMLGGYRPAREGGVMPPGVAWASAAKEVYPSWDVPDESRHAKWDQVHGHTTIWHWTNSNWFVDYSIAANVQRDSARRFTRWTAPGGSNFYAIDQALGAHPPRFDIEPLPMQGEILWPV